MTLRRAGARARQTRRARRYHDTGHRDRGRVGGASHRLCQFGRLLWHAVAEHNDALKALIGAAPSIFGPGFILPASNGDVLRWCLSHGLRVVQLLTLMTVVECQEPVCPYIPSILY